GPTVMSPISTRVSVTTAFAFSFTIDSLTCARHTLPLHDALPILSVAVACAGGFRHCSPSVYCPVALKPLPTTSTTYVPAAGSVISEEHTSQLQSQSNCVCRLLRVKANGPAVKPPVSTRIGVTTRF